MDSTQKNISLTMEEYFDIRESVEDYLRRMREREEATERDGKKPSFYTGLSDKDIEFVERLASELYKILEQNEPIISRDILILLKEIGGEIKGFEHRFKTMFSIKRKIVSDSKGCEGDYRRACENLTDAIRYTIVIDDDNYVKYVDKYLHRLVDDMGYEIFNFKNNWGKPFYQGYNVKIKTPSGQIFELQFHTPYGYLVKEGSTRDLYQVARDDYTEGDAKEVKQKANRLRKFLQQTVSIPPGALEYKFEKKIKK